MSRPDVGSVTCQIADLLSAAKYLREVAQHLERLIPFDGDLPQSSQLGYVTRPRSFRAAFQNRARTKKDGA